MSDIKLERTNWIKLKGKSLFFVHGALKRFDNYNFNITQLDHISRDLDDAGVLREKLGKISIENILSLKPVKHDTAERFISVLNAALEARGSTDLLDDNRIVSAVFRMPQLGQILDRLDLTPMDLSENSGVSVPLVENIIRGGRVHLCAALKVRDVLLEAARQNGNDQHDQIGALLFGDITRIISDDLQGLQAILKDENEAFLIKESDLCMAPAKGHPWAKNGS